MYNDVQNGETPMKLVTFTQFRQNAASILDSVERGETVRVTRHGRPIAEVVPVAEPSPVVSWKRPNLGLEAKVEGASLSREVLRERRAR